MFAPTYVNAAHYRGYQYNLRLGRQHHINPLINSLCAAVHSGLCRMDVGKIHSNQDKGLRQLAHNQPITELGSLYHTSRLHLYGPESHSNCVICVSLISLRTIHTLQRQATHTTASQMAEPRRGLCGSNPIRVPKRRMKALC